MADSQPAERKAPEHFSVETVQHELFRLWGGDRESKSEAIFPGMTAMFVCAAALGHAARRRRPLSGKKVNLFRWSQLSSDYDLPILESLAVAQSGEVETLADPYRVMQIAQECAAGGVDLLRAELTGTRDRNLQTLARLVLEFEQRDAPAASRDPRLPEERRELSTDDIRSLIAGGETPSVEFKSTLRWSAKTNEDAEWLQKDVTKSLAAFMNGQGGVLLVGVADDRSIYGLERDMEILSAVGQGGRDGFLQAIANIVNTHLGAGISALIRMQFVEIDGRQICAIEVRPSPEPVYLHDKKAEQLYVRLGTTTRALTLSDATRYVRTHWQ